MRTVRGTAYLDRRSPENFLLLNPIWRTGVAVCEDEYLTDAFTREAVGFINEHDREPFFLYLPYTAPHTPLQATARYFERFPDIDDEHRRVYAAMVSTLDDGIGRILDSLEATGLRDDTIVVFLSDHGISMPFAKSNCYVESARTPLIPGVNDDEEHIRAVLEFICPHKNVIDYELLPYMRFGLGKYEMLGEVYELMDFKPPTEESLERLRSIIDDAFGRGGQETPGR